MEKNVPDKFLGFYRSKIRNLRREKGLHYGSLQLAGKWPQLSDRPIKESGGPKHHSKQLNLRKMKYFHALPMDIHYSNALYHQKRLFQIIQHFCQALAPFIFLRWSVLKRIALLTITCQHNFGDRFFD
jgi:hypothetical protein